MTEIKNRVRCPNCSEILWQVIITIGSDLVVSEIHLHCTRCGCRMRVNGVDLGLAQMPPVNPSRTIT